MWNVITNELCYMFLFSCICHRIVVSQTDRRQKEVIDIYSCYSTQQQLLGNSVISPYYFTSCYFTAIMFSLLQWIFFETDKSQQEQKWVETFLCHVLWWKFNLHRTFPQRRSKTCFRTGVPPQCIWLFLSQAPEDWSSTLWPEEAVVFMGNWVFKSYCFSWNSTKGL